MPDATLAPLPIFSAQAGPHVASRVASGSFCRLTDGCQPVSFRQVRTCRRIRSDQLWPISATEHSRPAWKKLATIPDAGGQLPARVRLSQSSALGRITAATGAPQ
jgi:hypothetical protein